MRAIASLKLSKLATRLKADTSANEAEQAQHQLLAADIKRFLDRPAEIERPIPASASPPGAPIGGDTGMDWLARPPQSCTWNDANPDSWITWDGSGTPQ